MSVSITRAKEHLRVDDDLQTTEISSKLTQAIFIVRDYIGATEEPHPAHQEIIDACTLLVLGELFANRESSTSNPLSPTVRGLLERLRTPGYA